MFLKVCLQLLNLAPIGNTYQRLLECTTGGLDFSTMLTEPVPVAIAAPLIVVVEKISFLSFANKFNLISYPVATTCPPAGASTVFSTIVGGASTLTFFSMTVGTLIVFST